MTLSVQEITDRLRYGVDGLGPDSSFDPDRADYIEALERALHDICEEWAGAECGEPAYAQEAYAIGLAKRMYELAKSAIDNGV
jgi:hypothetical protein